MNELLRAYIPLIKYAAIVGLLGGIASFIGPSHHGLIKALYCWCDKIALV